MNRNILYAVVGGLIVAVGVLGYYVYQDRQKSGLEVTVGKGGVSIETK